MPFLQTVQYEHPILEAFIHTAEFGNCTLEIFVANDNAHPEGCGRVLKGDKVWFIWLI